MVAPRYGSWRIAFNRELVTSSTSGKETLPGEIVTTFNPKCPLGGGGVDGAVYVVCCGEGMDGAGGGEDGDTACVPPNEEVAGPVPEEGLGVLFDVQLPLE